MNEYKNATDVLIEAKSLLENVGWCKYRWRENSADTGTPVAYCAVGAIVSMGDLYPFYSISGAKTRLREAIGDNDIAGWNDHRDTTKEIVLQAFDKAIKGNKQDE